MEKGSDSEYLCAHFFFCCRCNFGEKLEEMLLYSKL